ncbi:uncharacterized protein LOC105846593 isoform X1 [Hydra vulgaris]|uniref:uncharacterized protein LOC105846593 isoform X1 n=1 Tax=Hydra vulgaris TaxID=6087 RepID=UPI000640BD8D|nr:uncharacterized protein LOC105846593 isoform X1 [Hydra vulgaris]
MFSWLNHFVEKEKTHRKTFIDMSNRLSPILSDKFKPVVSLDSSLSEAISLEYVQKPGWYLTCKNRVCYIEKKKNTRNYERQSSFYPLHNLWFDGFTAFESTIKAGFYLRLSKFNKFFLDKYDCSETFKQEASFCVQKYSVVLEEKNTRRKIGISSDQYNKGIIASGPVTDGKSILNSTIRDEKIGFLENDEKNENLT